MRWLADLIIRRVTRRAPDQIIGSPTPLLHRWFFFRKNRWFNIYLHHFLRDDNDRVLHDHPWWNCSIVLRGGYNEIMEDGCARIWNSRGPGSIVIRRPRTAHRLVLSNDSRGEKITSWSLFIIGPKVREWGFHCPRGWVHWKDFCSPGDENAIGPGCEGEITVPVFTDDPGEMDRQFIEDSRKYECSQPTNQRRSGPRLIVRNS